MPYFHQHKEWPRFKWDSDALLTLLARVREKQGRLVGRLEHLGISLRDEAILNTVVVDVVKSNEIEGDLLNQDEVRSSVAQHLGLEISGLPKSSRLIDGIVEMTLDATQNCNKALSKERLCDWQAALFPTGRSGISKIRVGKWRNDKKGPMQVVSGTLGKEKVHYVAPDAAKLDEEMNQFLDWFNIDNGIDPVLKSGIAHLWFVSIHPFADGNGRIARAIADMQLARADRTSQRFYSVSDQIMKSRKAYYTMLESTQKGNMDVTQWLVWYFECIEAALAESERRLNKTLQRADFWKSVQGKVLNDRHIFMLNALLGDFYGKLTSSKWAKMTKVHRDTARRDIQELIELGILKDTGEGGRSTNYVLVNIDY